MVTHFNPIVLKQNEEIVQLWRTTDFDDDDKDSILTVQFKETSEGCEVILTHTNIPERQSNDYKQGWAAYYFEPMKKYFLGKATPQALK